MKDAEADPKPSWLPAGIFLATFAAFLPTLTNGFINYDEPLLLRDNPHIRGFTIENLRWMFTDTTSLHYFPLTWLSFALDYAVWGMDPTGFHLTSLVLHALTATAFYFVSRRLLRQAMPSAPGAFPPIFAALFFGLHPLRVESVAWAMERHTVLSGVFYMLSILGYLRAAAQDHSLGAAARSSLREGMQAAARPPTLKRRELGWSAASFILALLAKETAIMLPAVLLLLDVYPLQRLAADPRRWSWRRDRAIWLEKLLYAAPAAGFGLAALAAQTPGGWHEAYRHPTLLQGLAINCYGIIFYLLKNIVPIGILGVYPVPKQVEPLAWPFLPSIILVAGVTAALVTRGRRWPGLIAAWIFYLISLAPAMVKLQIHYGSAIVADRYAYLASLSCATLAAAFLRRATPPRLASAGALVILFGTLAWRQTKTWHDAETFWRSMVLSDPGHWAAQRALGNLLMEKGDLAGARSCYEAALAAEPGFAVAHNNLGNVLSALGRQQEALKHYRQALRLKPSQRTIHYNIGAALELQGKQDEALAQYREELRIDPGSTRALAAVERLTRTLSRARTPRRSGRAGMRRTD